MSIARQPIQLGNDKLDPVSAAGLNSLSQLGTISSLAALDFLIRSRSGRSGLFLDIPTIQCHQPFIFPLLDQGYRKAALEGSSIRIFRSCGPMASDKRRRVTEWPDTDTVAVVRNRLSSFKGLSSTSLSLRDQRARL